MNRAIAVLLLLVMTGCASITGSKLQPVSVQTILNNNEVAGAGCTLTNDAGKWFVTTPGSVTIQKSTGDLAVDCNKDGAVGHETSVSKANGGVWGNIIAGGGIGYIVDRNTGAGFDYPPTITVMLHGMLNKIGEAVGATSISDYQKSQENRQGDSQSINTIATNKSAVAAANANATSGSSLVTNENLAQKLRELGSLRKDGVITEDEFQKKKQQLLDKL